MRRGYGKRHRRSNGVGGVWKARKAERWGGEGMGGTQGGAMVRRGYERHGGPSKGGEKIWEGPVAVQGKAGGLGGAVGGAGQWSGDGGASVYLRGCRPINPHLLSLYSTPFSPLSTSD